MPRLLIIADDLTGALDTGVKFSEAGLQTVVSTDWKHVRSEEGTDVLVLCADTRHISSIHAYQIIRQIVKENIEKFSFILKKTDSGLRGNIGAELQAVLDGSSENVLAFLPALPQMQRITIQGIHYIEGKPVSQSVFGLDPFEPVTDDSIPALLNRQCRAKTQIVPKGQGIDSLAEGETILIFDAETDEDMEKVVTRILSDNRIHLLAGCAGIAKALAKKMGTVKSWKSDKSDKPLLVICGSINNISAEQLDYAEKNGFARFRLPMDFLLSSLPINDIRNSGIIDPMIRTCRSDRPVVIDTGSPEKGEISDSQMQLRRAQIANRLGELIKTLLECGFDRRILIIGGDTIMAFMDAVQSTQLSLLCEPAQGVVLSCLRYKGTDHQIMSKSGGFGKKDLLLCL